MTSEPVRIALGPKHSDLLRQAITGSGATLSDLDRARALVWDGGPAGFPRRLPAGIEWVQLFSAGVEEWFETDVFDAHPDVVFTSAAGAFARSVAEHALALLLAGVRHLPEHIRASSWRQTEFFPRIGTLRGATVAVVGAGGIGRELIELLAPLGARVIAVNRSGRAIDHPTVLETIPAERLSEVWPRTDHVVVAAPATAATRQLIGKDELSQLRPHSWVINIARGRLIDTDALVDALRDGTIGGAGLDVTDPEPLPDGHPLWDLPNAIVTPHDSNPPQLRTVAFAERVADNVARFVAGRELNARIDLAAGY
ncbi:D-isomer specific 2-hydroxyacid dehydrogenase family protein [Nocardia sp. CDC159]|uniref:D-isomer specific 2-hydroxyacid dehydrogenase family protein n=1 Tax=Nocardia pulmonis TaxID=2951408 RepID=A0A9X2EB42_9NOCA|nr:MULTISPECIES: D-isomer specific 2-hydroxyacid dehydrogenase family protein [Nocardia]MCM6777612.1 D-isomer specific 2-hydroxyacid dehydrogenase family protein [Nocardia pulmonis]MCM6790584.1 D-isomer specific 2-hydroxyacid dehydrogenase family protein [Nocardia sp. CDC159]